MEQGENTCSLNSHRIKGQTLVQIYDKYFTDEAVFAHIEGFTGAKEKPAVTVAALKNGGTPISELTPPSSLTLENGVPTSYKRVVTGKAAAYSASAGAKTASGRTVKPGYIAVDPNQFPYGMMH